jgi:hypothetical protein
VGRREGGGAVGRAGAQADRNPLPAPVPLIGTERNFEFSTFGLQESHVMTHMTTPRRTALLALLLCLGVRE